MDFYIFDSLQLNPDQLKKGITQVSMTLSAKNKSSIPEITFTVNVPSQGNDLLRFHHEGAKVTSFSFEQIINKEKTDFEVKLTVEILKVVSQKTEVPFWIVGKNNVSNQYTRNSSFDVNP